jgi:type VI secretion system (T6SS) phospholipase Tle1-like effector
LPKNILIFSDGTGQRGGQNFDELRTNIYKLYRATRCGPDSIINPAEQLAFYDPGLGTRPPGEEFFVRTWRRFYNFVSSATGLGLTQNIIDCHAAIIRMWQPGDRIYLFGFSRGAYTARCIAAVLALCGVPTRGKNGQLLRRDESSAKKIAREAVTKVYQHVGSPRDTRYLPQREALAALFRDAYGSNDGKSGSNAYPYFIGVFETGAALANKGALAIVAVALLAILIGASAALWFFFGNFYPWLILLTSTTIVILLAAYIYTHLKFSFRLKNYSFWQTLHITALRQQFYDQTLNPNVRYAKHALSLDERRADFGRVKWGDPQATRPSRDEHGYIWFEQYWFAGNHSDIGGGYSENESRLSDIALAWMVDATQRVPSEARIKINPSLLRVFPSAGSMQHDETKSSIFRYARTQDRDPPKNATLHDSVRERFKLDAVLQYDVMAAYRPECLRHHQDLGEYYKDISCPAGDRPAKTGRQRTGPGRTEKDSSAPVRRARRRPRSPRRG